MMLTRNLLVYAAALLISIISTTNGNGVHNTGDSKGDCAKDEDCGAPYDCSPPVGSVCHPVCSGGICLPLMSGGEHNTEPEKGGK